MPNWPYNVYAPYENDWKIDVHLYWKIGLSAKKLIYKDIYTTGWIKLQVPIIWNWQTSINNNLAIWYEWKYGNIETGWEYSYTTGLSKTMNFTIPEYEINPYVEISIWKNTWPKLFGKVNWEKWGQWVIWVQWSF